MKEKDFEIMAPVGSYESLMAAIQGGADSIYFGIEGLNMRSRSSNNFTTEDLRKIVAICGEHGIKSYLTVNTVIYGEDLPLMREIIDAAKDAGVSAIIAADVAAMSYANSIGQEVHLSPLQHLDRRRAMHGRIDTIQTMRQYAHRGQLVLQRIPMSANIDAICESANDQ